MIITIKNKKFIKKLLIVLFLFMLLMAFSISASTYTITFLFQQENQEQKPPEKKEEKKDNLDEMIKKDETILPAEILHEQVDPFKSPMDEAAEQREKEGKLIGVAAMSIEELTLVGLVRDAQGYLAVVRGPDNVGYFLKVNDEVFNGRVVEIDMEKIVFEQAISDPYALTKTRRIIKKIHPEREGSE